MLKIFNCLALDILPLGYLSHFFLIDSEKFKLIRHLYHFTLNFVHCRHFTEMRPTKRRNLVEKVLIYVIRYIIR